MKNYRILFISFVLLVFMIGAVSAGDVNSSDDAVATSDESTVGIEFPGIVIPDFPIGPDEDPVDVEVTTKEIYVSDTGNDSNVGSKESPYATIKKAYSDVNASNDATIHIGEGTFFLEGTIIHYYEDYGDFVDEWDDEYKGLYIDLNHNSFGGNLKFIGAGPDKTFLDGQSAYNFATIASKANVTVKDLTFINCKNNDLGGTISNQGILTVENCVFKDSITTGSQGGAISAANDMFVIGDDNLKSYLTVKNSSFISCLVMGSDGGFMSANGGGAIYVNNIEKLYLENNTFINTGFASPDGLGPAVYMSQTKSSIINNKFINLTGTSDASLYLNPGYGTECSVIGNEFINCSNPSEEYSIVNLLYGNFVFENNTFINSTNSVGNIYLRGSLSIMNFSMIRDVINVSNPEVNKGVKIPITNITDDEGNIVKADSFSVKLSGNNTYVYSPTISGNLTFIIFNNIPENGIYNLTIAWNNGETDVLTTVNITLSNEPIDLYVSPKGSDANNGSYEYPFETIQNAIDVGFDKSFTVTVHLLDGTYSGVGNVALTIANKGTLQLVGENYGKAIIDATNNNWFVSIRTTDATLENLTFINGKSTSTNLIGGGELNNCIISNNTVNSNSRYVVYQSKLTNVDYNNNIGRIYLSNSMSNSNITNNEFVDLNNGGIIVISASNLVIENCTFLNNTATKGGVLYANNGFTSRNNNFVNNKASQVYFSQNYPTANYGVIFTSNSGTYTFENNTFVNNYAYESGVIGWQYQNNNIQTNPTYVFADCKFINNSAVEAGVTKIKAGSFTNCEFINNSADYGGAISLMPFVKNSKTLELINVTFNNNVANRNGNDIYLAPQGGYGSDYSNYIYAIDLTINFNNLNTSYLVDNLIANITTDTGISIGGNNVYFLLNETNIGVSEINNGVAILNYAGFEDGQYELSGYMNFQPVNAIVNNATVNVKLEGILDNVTYWVSNEGSDESGNGSEKNPFKSINYALTEGSKNCRNIFINIVEGVYAGDLNTNLELSSMNNVTIVGAGIEKTIIDGNNEKIFARITEGKNKITLVNLTIKNMLPSNVNLIGTATNSITNILNGLSSPISIDENATLYLDGVEITNCRGGQAIIVNNGNLVINNSVFSNNGISSNGLVSGGDVTIDNSVLTSNVAVSGLLYSVNSLFINNSVIKDNFNLQFFLLTGVVSMFNGGAGLYTVIENTIISNDGNNSYLSIIGYNETYDNLCPVFTLAGNIIANNLSMINNYDSPLPEYDVNYIDGVKVSPFGYAYGAYGKNVSVSNSTFVNMDCIWAVNTYGTVNFDIDSCVFYNLSKIAYSFTPGENSLYNITNSVFINSNPVIDRNYRSDRDNPNCTFENNYWGSNEKPVVIFINLNPDKPQSFEPNSWIVLYSEDEQTVIKNLTDGENITDYTGNAPIRTDYADNHGALDYAVVFGDVGYLFTTDDDKNVIFNPEDAMYPFVAADPMDYRTPSTIAITGFAGDLGIVCVLVDPVGNPIANATILSIINGENVANVTTDENGAFTVKGIKNGVLTLLFNGTDDYFDTEYNLTFTDAGKTTKSFIYLNIIEADLAVKGTLVDDEGSPIANAVITYTINGENATNVTTDTDGVFQVQGASNSIVDIVFAGSEGADAANTTLIIKDVAPTVVRLGSQFNVTEGVSIKTYAVDSKAGEVGQTTSFKLTDSNGNPIVNATVKFAYKTVILNRTTDENGIVFIGINTQLAQEALCAMSYLGDENYNATFVAFSFDIQKKPITITAPAKTYKVSVKTKKYTVTLKTEKCNSLDGKVYLSAGKKVTMKINGKTYTAKTNANGQATFNLKITKKGKFSGTVKFAGDKTYSSASKSVKITIK
ncbi:right-handed parallel beta-helix repeat-containing protein [uncultured Methanobrevibacter sp.]|uniref:right-handed parallel beta-helix repeat-containing protein n=1 Tax=uncultured Methanobrevibacter sp. TaxID=253161 RepID=UPI0025EF5BB9|nr:right-handed parallel beta-helix repeat-containing protein [uncultured Methanobrevibacter sp.]